MEVFLQAWQALGDFAGRSSVRTWLYRIATRACLGRRTRDRRRRRLLSSSKIIDGTSLPLSMTVPWLQPCPDDLLDLVVARDPDPASALVSRETVAIAFIAALQHLPERQRAVLVLRDVIGWPADRCAAALESTVPSVNSALQRARTTLRTRLGGGREEWPARAAGTATERAFVRRYIEAIEGSDDAAIAALLHDDVLVSHQPGAGGNDTLEPGWYAGRVAVIDAWAPALHSRQPLEMRLFEVWANRRPGVVSYIRLPGSAEHRAFALSLIRIHDDRIAEITNFTPDRLHAFGYQPLPRRALDDTVPPQSPFQRACHAPQACGSRRRAVIGRGDVRRKGRERW